MNKPTLLILLNLQKENSYYGKRYYLRKTAVMGVFFAISSKNTPLNAIFRTLMGVLYVLLYAQRAQKCVNLL